MRRGLFLLPALLSLILSSSASQQIPDRKEGRDLALRILTDPRIDRVSRMALELLQTGLNAGSSYQEVWIRDLNTFIRPALRVQPQDEIRSALLTFLEFQAEDGNIPDGFVSAEKADVGYEYLAIPARPELRAHKNTVETDQESSLVQAFCRYVEVTGDREILDAVVSGESVRSRLERALDYPLNHRFSDEYGLIWGATTADWGDVQPEHPWGVELDESSHRAIDIYDNALLIAAIGDFLEVIVEDSERAARWQSLREELKEAVQTHLWDAKAGKFVPHLYLEESPFPASLEEEKIFYHGGTAVAMEAGLLSQGEILISYGQILANLRLSGAATLGLTLYPPYPDGSFQNPSMGRFSYQNGGDWTWFGARLVRQLARHGFVKEAYDELIPMLERVIRHDGFYEWWTVDNQPRGSGVFRGSAGVLLEAIEELRSWARGELSAD